MPIHRLDLALEERAAPLALECAQQQVVLDDELAEELAPLGHKTKPARDAALHRLAAKRRARETHFAGAAKKPHHRAEKRRFAGAIGTDHGDDGAFRDAQARPVQSLDAPVEDAQILYFEQCAQATPPR